MEFNSGLTRLSKFDGKAHLINLCMEEKAGGGKGREGSRRGEERTGGRKEARQGVLILQ